MQTNRQIGDRFDQWVFQCLKEPLTSLRMTIGSGSVFGDQDQFSDEFRISCKLRWESWLSRKDLLEPYDKEPVGVLRCPATAFRRVYQEDGRYYTANYAFFDQSIVLVYGKDF